MWYSKKRFSELIPRTTTRGHPHQIAAQVHTTEVTNKGNLDLFVRFPAQLHAESPNWVPPLRREVKRVLSDENPFFLHARKALFLASRGDQIVGRIAAFVDDHYIQTHHEKAGFFGFFESVEDTDVACALIDSVAVWLSEQGMEKMLGPMNPSTNEECGLLIDGFDSPPAFMMPYNPPYYRELLKAGGLKKVKELIAYKFHLDRKVYDRLRNIAGRVSKHEPRFRVRPLDKARFKKEVEIFKEIYNSVWERNWGFVPMTDEEIEFLAKRLRPLIVPSLIVVGLVADKTVGLTIALPDYNQALVRLRGSLFPFGWLKFLWYRRKITRVRCMIIGVEEKHRKGGITALLFCESLKAVLDLRYQEAEISWILEDNLPARRSAESVGAVVSKRYALYGKDVI